MSGVGSSSRPYAAARKTTYVHSSSVPDAFVTAAEAALAAFRGRPAGRLIPSARLKRLCLFLDRDALRRAKPYWILNDDYEAPDLDDRVDLALAHPAAAELEVLRVNCTSYSYRYRPRLESLSCAATLLVLELTSCDLEPPTPSRAPSRAGLPTPSLPRLTELRLDGCIVSEGYLQAVVDAAPTLDKLVLVNVHHKVGEKTDDWGDKLVADNRLRLQLRCPTVTAVVIDTSKCWQDLRACSADDSGIELDMPRLRSFSYWGLPVKLSVTSSAHELAQVDLYVNSAHARGRLEPASRMLRSFSSTRALNLRLDCIDDILVGEDEEGGVVLPRFPNLELLELHGKYEYTNHGTASALARLFGSCPLMSELRVRLWPKIKSDGCYSYGNLRKDPDGEAFGVSLDRFNGLASIANVQGCNGIDCDEISDLAALSSSCTLGRLRKVTLKFESKELNCLPVQLAKFLVQNAMELQEMRVDDGNQSWPHHLYNNVARWRADSLRRRNLPDTGDFQVYYTIS